MEINHSIPFAEDSMMSRSRRLECSEQGLLLLTERLDKGKWTLLIFFANFYF